MLKIILHIGIGGMHHGPKAVYDVLHRHDRPTMLFAGTISTYQRAEIARDLGALKSADEIQIIYASKSGTTMETMDNFEYFYNLLKKRFMDIDNRVVAITSEGSALWKKAREKGWQIHLIPQDIEGRFSVFTPAGTVPLGLAGIDTEQFVAAANAARLRQGYGGQAPAFAADSAKTLLAHYQKGIRIINFFFFNPELESLGKWCRQLFGESLGKDGKGILPIVSIGTDDLHSMLQYYLEGPQHTYTIFVSAKPLPKIVGAILEGVKISYKNRNLPFEHIELPELNEYHLGFFMQTKMLEVIELAKLIGVDPYTQPAVDEYKRKARKLLA